MPLPAITARQIENLREQCRLGRPQWGDRETRIPIERYFSEDVWRKEVYALFRPLPLVAAHSSELAPGQVLAHDGYGVPILLARDDQGTVRAFLNVCRHRGMRLVDSVQATGQRASVVCPYHGWTYGLDGQFRRMLHAKAFDACPAGMRDLAQLPCVEGHGLIWVAPGGDGDIDLDGFLAGLGTELPFYEIGQLQLFRTVQAEYPANWKLIIEAFLESYHIRVLHRDTIYPFFSDCVGSVERFGPHIASLVARRPALDWAQQHDATLPSNVRELCDLATPSQVIFPNTVTVFHPDYLSLISVYPTSAETFCWTHRMLIPRDKATPDWTPHWEKTFGLIEQNVFQKEDIHCAVSIQKGLKTGANTHLTAGRIEQGLGWFHDSITERVGA